ncbi:MAG TPA: PilZ domain-containing protein [Nitrospira sp.]|nr:PilZ domain-containing protein [Nitrospira sp.]
MQGLTFQSERPRPSTLNRYRRHPRVRIATPFACALAPVRPRRWLRRPPMNLGLVYDLSVRGARVSTEAPFKPGDEVTLRLRLPKQIRSAEIAVATVRWTKDQFFGLAFRRVSFDAHDRLKKFVSIGMRSLG